MSKALRLSEKWFQLGLWLVALVFASFLIGLGGIIVQRMHSVEAVLTVDQFIDPRLGPQLRAAMDLADKNREQASNSLDQAKLKHGVALANTRAARASFQNWIATRGATARPDQDPDLIARTSSLDMLGGAERKALAVVEAQQQALLDATQARNRAAEQWQTLETAARIALDKAARAQELRIFLYRLLLTLPLLLAAVWLFVNQRKSAYWPFAWGFIFFAGFAFFVELVPYLPSYGGYVRQIVGIILTVVVGRQAIVSLQRYLARQKAAEAMPDAQRHGLRQCVAHVEQAGGVALLQFQFDFMDW